jgi:hypothetical protein
MGLCGLADDDVGGEGVFFRPFSISSRFISSFPVVSVISSFGSRWLMSSFDDSSDAAAISVMYWYVVISLHYTHAGDD